MPKLLQICVEGNTGSTGTIAESIGGLVMKRGWESYIAHGRFPRPSKSNIIHIGSYFDVLLHGIETRIFDRHCLGSRRATKKLISQIQSLKPNIIHIHHLHGYYINIEILFEYLSTANIPISWTFHDCWSITGHCCHFDYVGCEKWKTECYNCPQKKEYPASYFIDRSKKNYILKKELFTSVPNMTVISVSKWLNSIVGKSFMAGIPRQVIYNGIDIDIFKPIMGHNNVKNKFSILDGFMILGVAGVWSEQKGLSDFIKLSKNIAKKDFIVLVGLNKSQIKRLPLNIIGITHTENQQELKKLYDAADMYMNLSVEETFGLTTAEALACGTPAVVYNATACPEVIDSDTGFVVEKNDIKGLLNTIEIIKKNGKQYYSSACRSRAVNCFSKNDRFAEYVDLFESILKS
jgi:putative colanic acid biosynthesis glycosyltransferase